MNLLINIIIALCLMFGPYVIILIIFKGLRPWLRKWGLIIWVVCIIILFTLNNIYHSHATPERKRRWCEINLGVIWHASENYVKQYNKYPSGFEDALPFLPEDMSNKKYFLICANDTRYDYFLRDKEILNKTPVNDLSYIWLLENYHPDNRLLFPLIADKNGNHKNGRNVLFSNGDIKWLSESEFQDCMKNMPRKSEEQKR